MKHFIIKNKKLLELGNELNGYFRAKVTLMVTKLDIILYLTSSKLAMIILEVARVLASSMKLNNIV